MKTNDAKLRKFKQLSVSRVLKKFSRFHNKYVIEWKFHTASTIHVCSRNDPDLPKCILNSVAHLQPRLASGRLSDDFIIPALEPLILDT